MTSLNALFLSSWNSVKQRERLVEILLTKDAGVLLRVVKILETDECGYADLAKGFFADLDTLQTDEDKQAASKSLYICTYYIVLLKPPKYHPYGFNPAFQHFEAFA